MYGQGLGVTQDYTESVKWYRMAADQGYAISQHNLGFMYGEGLGVTQDYVQAHKWYNIAAARLPPGEDRDTAARDRDIVGGLSRGGFADLLRDHPQVRRYPLQGGADK